MDRDDLKDLARRLERQRDELRVQAHLAKAEAREEWEELEEKWQSLKRKLKAASEDVDDASDDVKAAASMLMDELKKGYERLRGRL